MKLSQRDPNLAVDGRGLIQLATQFQPNRWNQVVVPHAQIVPPKSALVVPTHPLQKMRAVDPPAQVRERCEAACLRWEREAIATDTDRSGSNGRRSRRN